MTHPELRRAEHGATYGWDAVLICVASLLAVTVGRLHLVVPGLAALRPALVFGALGVGLYALDPHPARRFHRLARPPLLALIGLCFWMAAGLPVSIRQYQSFVFLTDNFVKTVVIFVVVAGAVRSLKDVERLAWVYFASAAVYAAWVLSRFSVGGASWRLADLVTYDANDFAVLAVTAIALGLHFLLKPGRPARLKALDAAGVGVLSIGFVWAGSRGGMLALVTAALVFLRHHRGSMSVKRVAAVAAVTAIVVAVASPRYWTQMGTILEPSSDYNVTSETGRLQVWQRGLGYMKERPLFGVGVANFPAAEGTLSSRAWLQERGIGVKWSAAHNAFVQVGAELGVPGLVLFVAFLVAIWRTLRHAQRRASWRSPTADPQGAALAGSVQTALAGFLVGAFFLSFAYSDMLYVLAALAAGLGKLAGGVPHPAPRGTLRRPAAPGAALPGSPVAPPTPSRTRSLAEGVAAAPRFARSPRSA